MKQSKNNKESKSTRRQFIGQVGVGSTALVGLSSCELSNLNFIGKIKDSVGASAKPSEKDINDFIKIIAVEENVKKVAERMKKNLNSMNPVPAELAKLFSDEGIKKLANDETEFYTNFFKTRYTAGELRELNRILTSKLWIKYNHDLQEAGMEPGPEERPSRKFANYVNELMKNAMEEKMKGRHQPPQSPPPPTKS